jgi:hypothetical protein
MLIAMPLSASTPVKACPVTASPDRIKDVRLAVTSQGILQRLDAEGCFLVIDSCHDGTATVTLNSARQRVAGE